MNQSDSISLTHPITARQAPAREGRLVAPGGAS